MKTVGIFYGTTTGNTYEAAQKISEELGDSSCELIDVSKAKKDDLERFENIIFGVSTWGFGDLQDDWDVFIKSVENSSLDGKSIAFFGLGDQDSYPDTFNDAMGTIYETVKDSGAKFTGKWPTDGYDFVSSAAVVDGAFIGLALDEDIQPEKTEGRIKDWVNQIMSDFA